MIKCPDVRKQLKEYSRRLIKDEFLIKEMEQHISDCHVCKKELLLWQGINDKRQEVHEMQKNMNSDSLSRIKYRISSLEKGPDYPPVVRKLKQADKMFSMLMGRMTGAVILILGAVFIYKALSGGFKPVTIILIALSFLVFFWLYLRSAIKKKREKDNCF